MTRSLTLALLGLVLAGTPALARTRGENSGGARPDEAREASGKPAAAGLGRVAYAAGTGGDGGRATVARQAMHWRAAPVQGRFALGREDRAASANGACPRPRGARGCRPQPVLGTSGWARDLPSPAGVQAEECPSGTMATLARGHEDVIRCMPI